MRWMVGTRRQGKCQRLTMPLPSSTPGLRSNYSSRHSNPNWHNPTLHRQSQPTQAKVRKLPDKSGAVRQLLPENQTNPYKKLSKKYQKNCKMSLLLVRMRFYIFKYFLRAYCNGNMTAPLLSQCLPHGH